MGLNNIFGERVFCVTVHSFITQEKFFPRHFLSFLCCDHEVGPRQNQGLSGGEFLQKDNQNSVLKDIPWKRSGTFSEKRRGCFIPTTPAMNGTTATAGDWSWGPHQVTPFWHFSCCWKAFFKLLIALRRMAGLGIISTAVPPANESSELCQPPNGD